MPTINLQDDIYLINMAYEQAFLASNRDEVPVGAVIADESGKILACVHNNKEASNDPCGHAEIICLREAAKKIGNWRLQGCVLYVTLEPCPMCLAAMVQARIGRCVFGTYDSKGGAISLGYNLYKDPRLNHSFSICGGLQHYENSKLLSDFFRRKRNSYKGL